MIHLQCTARLLKYLRIAPAERTGSATSRLGDWHANVLFVAHHRHVLAVNDRTLLTTIVPLKESATLPSRWRDSVLAQVERLGASPQVLRGEADGMDAIVVTRSAGKREVGCLNELSKFCRYIIGEHGLAYEQPLDALMEGYMSHVTGFDPPAMLARRLLGVRLAETNGRAHVPTGDGR